MDKILANSIVTENKLISGKISKQILLSIINNEELSKEHLPEGVSEKFVTYLRQQFKNKIKELGSHKYPRNLIFYHLIQDKLPNFNWHLDESNQPQISGPRVKNLRVSLLNYLLGEIDFSNDNFLSRKYQCTKFLPMPLLNTFSNLFTELSIIPPSEYEMELIVNWLKSGINQESVTLFLPACPDYSAEETGDSKCPYRHNFKSLGTGLGLIAQRALLALPFIIKMLHENNIKPNIIVGFGDFEAYSEANLKIFHITEQEFIDRVYKSKEAFKRRCEIKIDACMLSELCGGKAAWINEFNKYKKQLNLNDFGKTKLTHKKLLNIASKRRNLYDRWYGKKNTLDEYIPYVINQGIEYSIIGAALSRLYPRCLILGADNNLMGPFYSIESPIPTLYLKRFYC